MSVDCRLWEDREDEHGEPRVWVANEVSFSVGAQEAEGTPYRKPLARCVKPTSAFLLTETHTCTVGHLRHLHLPCVKGMVKLKGIIARHIVLRRDGPPWRGSLRLAGWTDSDYLR